jgi:hypothetical protein
MFNFQSFHFKFPTPRKKLSPLILPKTFLYSCRDESEEEKVRKKALDMEIELRAREKIKAQRV